MQGQAQSASTAQMCVGRRFPPIPSAYTYQKKLPYVAPKGICCGEVYCGESEFE